MHISRWQLRLTGEMWRVKMILPGTERKARQALQVSRDIAPHLENSPLLERPRCREAFSTVFSRFVLLHGAQTSKDTTCALRARRAARLHSDEKPTGAITRFVSSHNPTRASTTPRKRRVLSMCRTPKEQVLVMPQSSDLPPVASSFSIALCSVSGFVVLAQRPLT